MRRHAALNVLKAWLLLAILAALFGAVGWALGGYRAASLFAFCALLAALAIYAYADRALMGMLGARAYALAEDPLLSSTVRASRLAGRRPAAEAVPDRGRLPARVLGRAWPRGSALAVSTGLLGALPPAELEGVLAHELAHVRSRDVLVQTFAVTVAVTLVELSRIGGWLERALLFVLGADRRGVRPPAALAATRVRRRPARRDRLRHAARPRRRAAPARPGSRPRLLPGIARDRAAVHGQPVRARGARADVRDAPAARPSASSGCAASTRATTGSALPELPTRPGGRSGTAAALACRRRRPGRS